MNQKITYQQIIDANISELMEYSVQIRNYFTQSILKNGGHFASNLGVVELTLALLHTYNPYQNQYIWDVGHQSYIFKMLTNRWDELTQIRQFNHISGFPKRDENPADSFGTGHSSTAISAALGIATANCLLKNKSKTIAIVGDGALTGGMAWEALNNVNPLIKNNLLIIINDNHIGIDPAIGNIDNHLQNIQKSNINIFQNLGINYTGPIDGHNIEELNKCIQNSLSYNYPQIIHIKTIKGKGYKPAELQQTQFHATSKFVKINPKKIKKINLLWQDIYGNILCKIAEQNSKTVAITPAMPSGSGLVTFSQKFTHRFFDVGIAEQHALTFAAGLATQGIYPYVNIYSTFLQRAYDQAIHDIALQNIPLTVAIDRAGLVGADGPTHHGAFDIAYLLPIPNIHLYAPATTNQFEQLLCLAPTINAPVFIRFPKGETPTYNPKLTNYTPIIEHKKGSGTLIISVGQATHLVLPIQKPHAHIQLLQLKPLPKLELTAYLNTYKTIITVEDGSITGGIGEQITVLTHAISSAARVTNLGIPDTFITHGSNAELYALAQYSTQAIEAHIK